MSKYGHGLDFVNDNPGAESVPRIEIPHSPDAAYFAESAAALGYDGFATANPVLVVAVLATAGPVVEIGAGFSSTPLLAAVCRSQRREFVSFEQEDRWRAVAQFFDVHNRSIDHSDPESVVGIVFEEVGPVVGTVFVDGGELYRSRGEIVKLLVVAHDFDRDNDTSGYLDGLHFWGNWFVYEKLFPNTLICSQSPQFLSVIENCV